MVITERFVFVHVPKTGGTWVERIIRNQLPVVDHPTTRHMPHGKLPDELRERDAFCAVRNPWDWYVSWYHARIEDFAQRERAGRLSDADRAVFDAFFDGGRASFSEAVTRACSRPDFDHTLATIMREHDVDLYSAYLHHVIGASIDLPNFTILRFERLRKQLMGYFNERGVTDRGVREAIKKNPPVRTSSHEPYWQYYDADLQQLVARRAAAFRERFGYRFRDPRTR